MMLRFIAIIGLLFLISGTYGQDYSWWNIKHNWDGVSSWKRYLISTPGYMGPNALPVPEINNGSIQDYYSLEIAPEVHLSKGDHTFDILTKFIWPVSRGKVSVGISYIPVEYYNTDTLTRDIRVSRDYDGKGISYGDIYVHTLIQVLAGKEVWPDIMITANIKTASGTNLGSARFTDTPGYYFDIAAGKDFAKGTGWIKGMRPYVLLGFYAYQTHRSDYLQNDCLLYGSGLDIRFKDFKMSNQLGGFIGYFNQGDRPLVYRLMIHGNQDRALNWGIRFQQGISDYGYSSFRFSVILNMDRILRLKE